ncbi:glutaredoxin family protein [uncultured Xylophilus sp.]|uniref:glutaredoxin family protein n=1 Tax=uncultured Xylophilus sp. TaxID=296832 RepID=UPI0025D0E07C|nr:glutaredoxin family protein [uncultured Xylophilus sp.]
MALAVRATALTLLLAGVASGAAAQVYRIIGPDGRVTFSDRPPAAAAAVPALAEPMAAGAAGPSLPFELRSISQRYPVVLYTSSDCGPCASARQLLRSRGVPFTEKTIATAEDSEALKRISGDSALPFATVGGQHLQGFSDAEWTQYLDAAGYPKQSQLPPAYQFPAATPLVAVQRPAAAGSARPNTAAPGPAPSAAGDRPAPRAPASRPSNPAGLQF